MTIIKQGGVSSKSHQRNLRAYINDDKKVLLRDSQNMGGVQGFEAVGRVTWSAPARPSGMIKPPVASATGRPAS